MREHPAGALMAAVTQLLDDAGRIALTGLSGAGLDAALEDGLAVISRLTVHLAALVEQAAAVDRPAELAAPSLGVWLRGRFGLTPQDASRLVRDMRSLAAAPVAAEAALAGAIPVQAAAAIGHAVADLPSEVGPELRAEGERVLLGYAVGDDAPALDARELTLVGRHLHEVLDPDAADRLLAARLERDDAAAHRRRFLSITDDLAGGVRLRGLLTAEAGATLRAALDPLAAPRPVVSGSGEHSVDDRSWGQRSADSLVELAERMLAHGVLPDTGGHRPQLIVMIDHQQLAAGLGTGTLLDGTEIPVASVRKLACDAGVVPAVLGTAGQVLDLGRSARTATPAQRRALSLRDQGCTFPGCERPPGWADAHHVQHWEDLGPTDLKIWSCSVATTTGPSTTTGRSPPPKTAAGRGSPHPPGSIPPAGHAATNNIT